MNRILLTLYIRIRTLFIFDIFAPDLLIITKNHTIDLLSNDHYTDVSESSNQCYTNILLKELFIHICGKNCYWFDNENVRPNNKNFCGK